VQTSHQTVRLSRGSHYSPKEGACVMELASMLARESFTDRPQSVSPVICDFLRAYNDWLDDGRRQDLYAYAAKIVGTKGSEEVERARTELCLGWAQAKRAQNPQLRFPLWTGLYRKTRSCRAVGVWAGRLATRFKDNTAHHEVLVLLDRLIELQPQSLPVEPDRPPQERSELSSAGS
jgi:hypothetical protein